MLQGKTVLLGVTGGIAASHGSYPWCRGFKSLSRYYIIP